MLRRHTSKAPTCREAVAVEDTWLATRSARTDDDRLASMRAETRTPRHGQSSGDDGTISPRRRSRHLVCVFHRKRRMGRTVSASRAGTSLAPRSHTANRSRARHRTSGSRSDQRARARGPRYIRTRTNGRRSDALPGNRRLRAGSRIRRSSCSIGSACRTTDYRGFFIGNAETRRRTLSRRVATSPCPPSARPRAVATLGGSH